MKKKVIIPVVIISIITSLCITTYVYYKNTDNKSANESGNNADSTGTSRVGQSNTKQPHGAKVDDNAYDITDKIVGQDNRIIKIHNFDKDRMYVITNNLTSNEPQKKFTVKLYNIKSGETEKQVDFEKKGLYDSYEFMPLNNGFCITYEERNDNSYKIENVNYKIYDSDFNLIKTFDLTNVVKEVFNYPIALSNNGDKIAYIDNSGKCIYICDLDLNNKRKVCETQAFEINKISFFHSISFVKGDKKIAFTGSIYINNDVMPKAFGVVDIESGKYIYKEHDGINNTIQISSGKTFFSDANTLRGKDSSGKVFLVDNSTDDISEYTLKDKNESQFAKISDKGNYIITYLPGKLEDSRPIYRFRIYDVKSKSLLKEFDATSGGSILSISEDNNSFYVACMIDDKYRVYEYKLN